MTQDDPNGGRGSVFVLVPGSQRGWRGHLLGDRSDAGADPPAVYVDSGPLPEGTAISPDLDPGVTEMPLPSWADLEADGSSLAGPMWSRPGDLAAALLDAAASG